MKKILIGLICLTTTLLAFMLAGCKKEPLILNYYINDNGILIAEYDDGSLADLGSLEDTIANGANIIEINADGYYVINGVATSIKAKLPISYAIDENGNLIVTYSDTTTENLGKFGSDAINTIESISVSDDGFYILNGIKTDIEAIEAYKVEFVTGYYATIPTQTVKDGYKAERPLLTREGYVLNGWFCNGEEWRFNSDVVKNNMTLTAEWTANNYEVAFETGIEETVSPITITYDSTYSLPELAQDGYTFEGWTYNGKIVTSSQWSIAENCTLQAKWTANTYTITLNANGGKVSSKTVKVTYGENFTLPIATNSYGTFLGWFYNGVQITDEKGHSLKECSLLSDIEVDTPWIVKLSTADDLQQLHTLPNAQFELLNDIDISAMQWIPVGTENAPFTGQIDGGNHAIKGLTITALQGDLQYYGFIGYADGVNIFDLSLTDVNISLPVISNSVCVGSVIAYAENSSLKDIATSGNIMIANHSSVYESFAGGLIGCGEADVLKNCSNSVNVTAKTAAGGIIGYGAAFEYQQDFVNNKNFGAISANIAGGMIGDYLGFTVVSECLNFGCISGGSYAGGLIGRSTFMAMIEKCANFGNISTASDVSDNTEGAGGLIGAITLIFPANPSAEIFSFIKNSYNSGEVSSHYKAGGFIGSSRDGNLVIEDCYNSGSISGQYYVGGVVGESFTGITIRECLNVGNISSDSIAATIGSIAAASTITDCYYNCSLNKVNHIQGTCTDDYYSEKFFTESMFWDTEIWDFHNDKLPTLKIEKL